jgi:type IV pilus assembly protein PilP
MTGSHHVISFLGVLMCAMLLASCTDLSGTSDLQQFVADIKARPPTKIEPYPEPKPVETFLYDARDRRDPFSPTKAGAAEAMVVQGGGVAPDPNRRKEELEQFPLDSLSMVGTLEKGQILWGLIKNREGLLYRVKPGNYMGQNNGQIISVGDTEIKLTEIVPDGLGGYREREEKIALAEK